MPSYMDLQSEIAGWHEQKFPDADKWKVLAKITEELGELNRAIIAEHEGRPGRGFIPQEAAQTAFCLMVLMGRFYPTVHLLNEVELELDNLWRKDEHA